MNGGSSSFHGLLLTLRRRYSSGLSYDFNYTWSHSIDTSSAPEGGAGASGAVIQIRSIRVPSEDLRIRRSASD